jgi:hypothetical protein
MEQPKYQPYRSANEPGNNDIAENRGEGATKPYIPNGWGQMEENTEKKEDQ